jgi:hypothetical protein
MLMVAAIRVVVDVILCLKTTFHVPETVTSKANYVVVKFSK